MTASLAVGITTRDRRASLEACVSSLERLAGLLDEIIVFDDGSEPPATVESTAARIAVLRDAAHPGYIVGRNRIMRQARAPYVLLLDDDTRILNRESIEYALRVVRDDPSIGAIAFAQAEEDGRPWPVRMQPARVGDPSVVPSYIGFAHLLRRDLFLELGGYREELVAVGEEKDLCLRLLERGYKTVYLPSALIAHVPDRRSRDGRRHLRHLVRSDCLLAMFNEPLLRACWIVPARYALYFRMRREWRVSDPWGWWWVARNILASLPIVLTRREAVSWATVRRWQALRRSPDVYTSPEHTGGTRA